MNGETNLSVLLSEMNPVFNDIAYVFCSLRDEDQLQTVAVDSVMIFREKEGVTVILPQSIADEHKIGYDGMTYAMVTLSVHSSLEAIGFMAAISEALKNNNIPSNVVSAYYHDHLFVPYNRAADTITTLNALSVSSGS